MTVRFTFHGHSTLSFRIDGIDVVVDPFFQDNPLAKTSIEDVAADFILLSHGHGDHVGDVMSLAPRTGATVVSNFEIVTWVNNQGYENTHPQHIGGGWNHAFGHLKLTPALHGSMLPDGSNGGMPAGLLITANDARIYVAGDTALFSDMSLIGRGGIDLAVLPIGDNFTMGPDDALEAVKLLKPGLVVPCHYGTWPFIDVDADDWATRVAKETDSEATVMEVDTHLTL